MSKRAADEPEVEGESAKKQKMEGAEEAQVAETPIAEPVKAEEAATEAPSPGDTTPAQAPAEAAPAAPAPATGGSGLVPEGDAFAALPISTQSAFKSAFASNKISLDDVDSSIYDSLKDFEESTQLKITNSFLQTDLSTIRNKSGYMIGILKKYRSTGEGMGRGAVAPAHAMQPPAASPYGASPYGQQYNPYDPTQAYAMMYAAYGMQYPGMAGMEQYGAQQPGMQQPGMPASASIPAAFDFCTTEALKPLPQSVKNILNGCFAKGEVAPTDIEESVWDSMKDFDEMTQVQIVERFGQANMSTVRNKTGYMIGILKIFRSKGPAARAPPQQAYAAYGQQMQGYGQMQGHEAYAPQGIAVGGGAFTKLNMSAQLKIQELYNSGRARPGEIEDGVFDSLKDFNEVEQLEMVESFVNTDLATIRNKTAFFIGILKLFRQKRQGGGGF